MGFSGRILSSVLAVVCMTAKLFHVEHSGNSEKYIFTFLSTQGSMFHVEHLEFLSSQKTGDDSLLAECSAWNMRKGLS